MASDESKPRPRGFIGRLLARPGREATAEGEGGRAPDVLVDSAQAFKSLRVADVMTPRADIIAVELSTPFNDLLAEFVESEHSRMPIYRETLDDPVGVVHVKDVFKLIAGQTSRPAAEAKVLPKLKRELLYVPPSMPAAALLAKMQTSRIHMAVVIDEFGGADGLVTLEDLVEAVVGEIDDEHDETARVRVLVRGPGLFEADGRVSLEDLYETLGADLTPPDLEEDIDTVGGLVSALAGRVPQRGEVIAHPTGFEFQVVEADPRRVARVRIRDGRPATEVSEFLKRLAQAGRRVPVWMAAPLCGLAAGLAHPPTGFLPGLLGYAGLMVLCQTAPSLKAAFWRGWLAGAAYFAISCWWVYDAFQVDAATFGWMAPFAVAFLAGGLALFWGVAALIFRAGDRRNPLSIVWFAGIFACLEWARGHVMTGFPWNLPGETWKAGGMMSQFASVVGAYGLTWITLAVSAAPGLVVVNPARRSTWVAVGAAGLALGGVAWFGAVYLSSPPDHAGKTIAIRIVQPNFPEVANEDTLYEARLAGYTAMSAQAPGPGGPPQLIFWPEGALPIAANDLLAEGSPGQTVIAGALTPGQILVFGGIIRRGTEKTPKYYNSLIAVQRTANGLRIVGVYDKYRLVPFGEYVPHFLEVLGLQHLVPVPGDLATGPEPAPINIGPVTLQPLICYESLFPGFTRQGERASGRRADLIANLSDDSWFGVTSGPLQTFNLSSYRAIEEGLTLVRSTPNGVSAVVDPHGRVVRPGALGLGRQGVIDVAMNTVQFDTAYRRFGDAAFAGMLLLSLLALGVMRLGKQVRT